MLQAHLIGNIGANAEIKAADGREFVTFRVAHNETYKDAGGNKVDKTMWIDCTMSCDNGRPAVLPYLQQGTLVYIAGSITTRVYSSEKDRCMKAGITIHVQRIELLGGQGDIVPRRLFTADGEMLDVVKYYLTTAKDCVLMDARGKRFQANQDGWVTPITEAGNGTQQ